MIELVSGFIYDPSIVEAFEQKHDLHLSNPSVLTEDDLEVLQRLAAVAFVDKKAVTVEQLVELLFSGDNRPWIWGYPIARNPSLKYKEIYFQAWNDHLPYPALLKIKYNINRVWKIRTARKRCTHKGCLNPLHFEFLIPDISQNSPQNVLPTHHKGAVRPEYYLPNHYDFTYGINRDQYTSFEWSNRVLPRDPSTITPEDYDRLRPIAAHVLVDGEQAVTAEELVDLLLAKDNRVWQWNGPQTQSGKWGHFYPITHAVGLHNTPDTILQAFKYNLHPAHRLQIFRRTCDHRGKLRGRRCVNPLHVEFLDVA